MAVRLGLLAVVLLMAACGGTRVVAPAPTTSVSPPTVPVEPGEGSVRLSVAAECCYVEGSATQVRLTGPAGVVIERVYRVEAFVSGQAVFALALPSGTYVVETGQLVCVGFCREELPASADDRCRGISTSASAPPCMCSRASCRASAAGFGSATGRSPR